MANRETTIDIVLATYHGEKFLAAQLDSIFAQSGPPLRLLARDDGSTDRTASILADYAGRQGGRMVVVESVGGRLGASGSFGELLQRSTAEYVMLCDQDDVWLPDRVAKLLGRVQAAEAQFGRESPVLVHSDLAVVSEQLETVHPSFWKYEHLAPVRGAGLNRLLVQNVVTGCALMVNRALLRLALPIPPEAIMHDWWLALAAAAFGRLECLPEATVLYRQHGGNRVGAKRWGAAYVADKLRSLLAGDVSADLRQTQRQARAFLDRFDARLRPDQRSAVAAYAALADRGALARRLILLRYGFLKSGWIRNLGLFAAV